MDIDPLDFVSPERSGENGRPFDLFARIRREAPVLRCEPPSFKPFIALTIPEDITAVSRDRELFGSEGHDILSPEVNTALRQAGIRSVVKMAPPGGIATAPTLP